MKPHQVSSWVFLSPFSWKCIFQLAYLIYYLTPINFILFSPIFCDLIFLSSEFWIKNLLSYASPLYLSTIFCSVYNIKVGILRFSIKWVVVSKIFMEFWRWKYISLDFWLTNRYCLVFQLVVIVNKSLKVFSMLEIFYSLFLYSYRNFADVWKTDCLLYFCIFRIWNSEISKRSLHLVWTGFTAVSSHSPYPKFVD